MEKKLYDHFIIMQDSIEDNKKADENTQKVHESELTNIKTIIENIMFKIEKI